MEIFISLFFAFSSCLQFGWQKWPFLRKFCEKYQFLEFQKNDVYGK